MIMKQYNRYLLVLVMALMTTAICWSQEVPQRSQPGKFAIKKVDFDHVKKVISDPKNVYYYPKLMKAYNSNDTTLSIEA